MPSAEQIAKIFVSESQETDPIGIFDFDSTPFWNGFYRYKFGVTPSNYRNDRLDYESFYADASLSHLKLSAEYSPHGDKKGTFRQLYINERWKIFAVVWREFEDDKFLDDADILLIYHLASSKARELVKYIDQNHIIRAEPAHKRKISFLCHECGFHLIERKSPSFEIKDLSLNYGDDFLKVDKDLREFLESNRTGLALLHGIPGVGKTSYIRYLISTLKKRAIYVPPSMMTRISDPDFLGFMLGNTDCILLIEDAEEILLPRGGSSQPGAVANLLNLTDGILGDALQVKAVCTFNSGLKELDPALTRKGRLIVSHEFKRLSIKDSARLMTHIGMKPTGDEMTLAEIYNFRAEEQRVGGGDRIVGFAPV